MVKLRVIASASLNLLYQTFNQGHYYGIATKLGPLGFRLPGLASLL